MDYESKILLNNLIDAVNGTDWWMFGVYVASIVASGALSVCLLVITRRIGKQQNRMQREQLLISNFNLYREIHRDLYHLKIYSRTVLPRIYDYFASNADSKEREGLEKLGNEFESMARKIEIDEADYLLKFGENEIIQDVKKYSDLISFIFGMATAFEPINNQQSTYSVEEKMQIRNLGLTDEQWLNKIEKMCRHEGFISLLNSFIEDKHRLFDSENNVLQMMQKACNECEFINE